MGGMKVLPIRILAVAIVLAALAAPAAHAQSQHTVPVYDATQIALERYDVVRRVGIDGWQSAFRIRAHGDLESAQRALLAEAARFGADGVINLTCFDQADRVFNPAGYFCYGNAIKLKK